MLSMLAMLPMGRKAMKEAMLSGFPDFRRGITIACLHNLWIKIKVLYFCKILYGTYKLGVY